MPPIETRTVTPYYQTKDGGETCRIYLGDAADILRSLPPRSAHMCVTSPPYYGLRKYGGDDREIGAERTVGGYVANLVNVFREVRRVLRNDGTLWLNLGDCYYGYNGYNPTAPSNLNGSKQSTNRGAVKCSNNAERPAGNVMGVPWLVALALQNDGWILRQEIIWDKPDAMPQSVTDRCTTSHEYVFLLVKSGGYFCDMEAIKEPLTTADDSRNNEDYVVKRERDFGGRTDGYTRSSGPMSWPIGGRNKRTVWRVAAGSGPSNCHFATFPRRLIEPMILAGTSEYGCCPACQTPYRRVVSRTPLTRERPNDYVKRNGVAGTGNSCANSVAGVETKTLGWEPGCRCGHDEVMPCTVLEPFLGSGTTAEVALDLGRNCVGIDLVEKYLKTNAVPRVRNLLLSRPDWRHLA